VAEASGTGQRPRSNADVIQKSRQPMIFFAQLNVPGVLARNRFEAGEKFISRNAAKNAGAAKPIAGCQGRGLLEVAPGSIEDALTGERLRRRGAIVGLTRLFRRGRFRIDSSNPPHLWLNFSFDHELSGAPISG
jgi:hypothetical protein